MPLLNITYFYPEKMAKKLSIIITAYNEEKYVGNLLEDILKSEFKDFEVFVVDNNSVDNTKEVVEPYTLRDDRIKLVECFEQGVSQARNYGAKDAEGHYLLFFDADARIDAKYLGNSVSEMEKRKLDITCHYEMPYDGIFLDKVLFWALNNFVTRPLQYIIASAPGSGAIMATREMHEKINGFSIEKSNKAEDLDYQRRAAKIGTYRMLNSAVTQISMRRFDKDGRINTWFKWGTIYMASVFNAHNLISSNFYQFGKFRE